MTTIPSWKKQRKLASLHQGSTMTMKRSKNRYLARKYLHSGMFVSIIFLAWKGDGKADMKDFAMVTGTEIPTKKSVTQADQYSSVQEPVGMISEVSMKDFSSIWKSLIRRWDYTKNDTIASLPRRQVSFIWKISHQKWNEKRWKPLSKVWWSFFGSTANYIFQKWILSLSIYAYWYQSSSIVWRTFSFVGLCENISIIISTCL